jgi:gluconokinase
MNDYPLVWIIMGVAGAGKTVAGRLLSARLDCDFLEGDRRHPVANIMKILAGNPLQDEDRLRWLKVLESDIRQALARDLETVLTCSALKASYRQRLDSLGRVQPVWLHVPEVELRRRLQQRLNHYLQLAMLESQIAALEPIGPNENVITIDGLLQPKEVVEGILVQAVKLFPGLKKTWWQRVIS